MGSILHLRKELVRPPVALCLPRIVLRAFELAVDIPSWLELRDIAMADQVPRIRSWNEADFLAEMVSKSWWKNERTWLAIAEKVLPAGGESQTITAEPAATSTIRRTARTVPGTIIGAVTLAMREGQAASVPVVHWLLVDPAWRRRGVGRTLLSHLEREAWDAGWREVQLETHAGWQAAVAFYQSIGYAPVRERSLR
jgi:GNAT superfamily N-acetyltransferase